MGRLACFCIILIFYLLRIVSADPIIIVIKESLRSYKGESRSAEQWQENFRNDRDGIFEKFVREYLQLLKGITGSKVRKYCRTVERHLRDAGYQYTRRLARLFKNWAEFDESIAGDIEKYLQEFDNKLPHRTAFFEAMNHVFTLQQAVLFDDYIYDLTNYGNERKLDMDSETRKLIKDVIIYNIEVLSRSEKRDLEKKLKKAIKEYKRNEFHDFMKSKENNNESAPGSSSEFEKIISFAY